MEILLAAAVIIVFTACGAIGQHETVGPSTQAEEIENGQKQGSKDLQLWIAPEGCDDYPGTEQAPLATTEEALKRLRAEDYDTASILYTVGTHYISAPICLEKGDHDICFSSAGEEKPLISGAIPVTGWKLEVVNGIEMWVVQLEENHRAFQSLYSNRGNLPRSRWPKEGYFFVRTPQDALAPDQDGRDRLGRYAMYVGENDIQSFHNFGEVTLKILHRWKDETLNIRNLNPETGRITFSKPSTFRVEAGERYYYENVWESLCVPGEWYFDQKTGKLYYIPMPDDVLGETKLYAGETEQFLICKGASDISFQNLEFAMGDWSIPSKTVNEDGSDHHQAAYDVVAAFDILNTEGIRFENCSFSHINATCLKFGYRVQGITVRGNSFRDIGANAIFLVGQNTDRDSQYATRNFIISDNLVDGYGQRFFNGAAIAVLHAASGEISNNELHNGFSSAIALGWVWGYGPSVTSDIVVRQNLIYDVGQNLLSDMGAIYTLGVKEGIRIEENVIYNVKANLQYGYGGWGIYMDEGSSNVMITKNLVYDCNSTAFYQHYGRDNLVINNIFALCGEGQISSYRDEVHTGFHILRNIIVSENQDFIKDVEQLNNRSRMTEANNLYWDYIRGDRDIDINYYTEKLGLFHNATFADPGFVNWEERNFVLQDHSPAFNLGFISWDISQAGLLKK